jgi:hypothetical protein
VRAAVELDGLSSGRLKELVADLLAKLAELERTIAVQRAEIAGLKGLKGRPEIKPSGMEKATTAKRTGRGKRHRRGKSVPRALGVSISKRQVMRLLIHGLVGDDSVGGMPPYRLRRRPRQAGSAGGGYSHSVTVRPDHGSIQLTARGVDTGAGGGGSGAAGARVASSFASTSSASRITGASRFPIPRRRDVHAGSQASRQYEIGARRCPKRSVVSAQIFSIWPSSTSTRY